MALIWFTLVSITLVCRTLVYGASKWIKLRISIVCVALRNCLGSNLRSNILIRINLRCYLRYGLGSNIYLTFNISI